MATILTILFLCLAAIAKAVADTLSHHFPSSIFKWKDPRWWDPRVSWDYVGFIRFTKYRPDAWHLANSAMIIFFCLAVCVHRSVLSWWWEVLIAGTLYNLTFNLFYNKILYRHAKD